MSKVYNKLVRDRIPEIIEKAGEKPYIETLNKKEFFEETKKKISEEARELIKAKGRKQIINEIVDIQELIDVLVTQIGITKLELWTLQRKKNIKRGGFKKRLFLIGTKTKPRA